MLLAPDQRKLLTEERKARLREMDGRRSLALYLALWDEFGPRSRGVSEFVMLTRRAFARRSRGQVESGS